MSIFHAILLTVAIIAVCGIAIWGFAVGWRKVGKTEAEAEQKEEQLIKSWEEAEHEKHIDAITPSTNSDIFERLRRNNKG